MPRVVTDMIVVLVASESPTGTWHHLQLLRSPTRKAAPNLWSLLRGHIEPGETSPQAALRELTEEAGLSPATPGIQLHHLSTPEHFYIASTDTLHLVPAFAAIVPWATPITLNNEHTAHRWLADTELESHLTWASELPLLHELRDFILSPRTSTALLRI